MTPQEKDLITTLLSRLKNAAAQPKDAEADALIRQAMAEQPDAPYYLAQTVLIQDLSLHNAQNRIAELERQLTDAHSRRRGRRRRAFSAACSARASRPPPPAPGAGRPGGRAVDARTASRRSAAGAALWPALSAAAGLRPAARAAAALWAAAWAAAWVAAAGFCARRRRQRPGSPAARCCSRGSSRCSAITPAAAFSAEGDDAGAGRDRRQQLLRQRRRPGGTDTDGQDFAAATPAATRISAAAAAGFHRARISATAITVGTRISAAAILAATTTPPAEPDPRPSGSTANYAFRKRSKYSRWPDLLSGHPRLWHGRGRLCMAGPKFGPRIATALRRRRRGGIRRFGRRCSRARRGRCRCRRRIGAAGSRCWGRHGQI